MSMRDTVHQSISRSNRNKAILSIIAILIAVAGFVGTLGKTLPIPDTDISIPGTSSFVLRQFGETQVMTEDELTSLTPADLPIFNVTLEGDEMFDSRWVEETTSTRNGISTGPASVTAYFGYLQMGDHFATVRVPGEVDDKLTDYKGALISPVEVGKQVYDDFIIEYPELENDLLPMMLDTAYDAMPWYIGAGAEAILLLGGLFGLATVASRANHDNHPIIKRMARFGEAESVMSQIDGEMMSGQVAQVDKLQITRNWVVYKSGNDMNFARITDIMWAYKHVTQTRYGKNYAAYIWDRSGQMLNIASKEKNVDEMIIAVLQRAPWAIAGYNKDIEKSWNSDGAGFVRTVDDRRQQMTTPQ